MVLVYIFPIEKLFKQCKAYRMRDRLKSNVSTKEFLFCRLFQNQNCFNYKCTKLNIIFMLIIKILNRTILSIFMTLTTCASSFLDKSNDRNVQTFKEN
jgi:hypothetical protein